MTVMTWLMVKRGGAAGWAIIRRGGVELWRRTFGLRKPPAAQADGRQSAAYRVELPLDGNYQDNKPIWR